MARQDLFQLGRGFEQNFTRDTNPGPNLDMFRFTNGSTGNPNLDPYRANAVRPELRVLLRRAGPGRRDAVLEGGRLLRHGRDAVDLRRGPGRRTRGTGAGSDQRRGRRHQGHRAVRRSTHSTWGSASTSTTRTRTPNRDSSTTSTPTCRSRACRRTHSTPRSTIRTTGSRRACPTAGATSRSTAISGSPDQSFPAGPADGGHHANVRHLESRLLPARCSGRLPVQRQARCDARSAST